MASADQTSLKLLLQTRTLLNQQKWEPAAKLLKQVLRLRPRDAALWMMLAQAQRSAGDVPGWLKAAEEAQRHAGADEALAQDATVVAVEAAVTMNDPSHALELAERLPPEQRNGRPHLLHLMGTALKNLGRAQEAVEPLMLALSQQVDSCDTYMTLGFVFHDLGMAAQAAECFRTVCTLQPQHVGAQAYLNYQEQRACHWGDYEERNQALLDGLGRDMGDDYVPPFALVRIPHTPAQLLVVARQAMRYQTRHIAPLPAAAHKKPAGQRLHVAYLSNDFFGHATATLITQVLECHDRGRFEVSLLSHGRRDASALRQRLERAGDRFEEMQEMSLADMARRVRELGVDILVDLKGHTSGSRLHMLAYRPAPVQVAWLGFPGTCGLDALDYVIGDPVVTPLAEGPAYSEKIAQMPHCYQPNDGLRERMDTPMPRSLLGLPEEALVLVSANQVDKLNPQVFDVWAEVLRRVPDAVLWQLTGGEASDAELRGELQRRGIAPERLIVMPRAGIEDHLRRLSAADIAIDCWPYNGHTTTSDALWNGVPVVTVRGNNFASRVSESLLRAVGLPELVCETTQDYVELVCALATGPARRAQLREHLRRARDASPLYDARGFARDLEALYERMWARHEAGLAPEALPAAG